MVELIYYAKDICSINRSKKESLQHFDAWAFTFGETVSAMELRKAKARQAIVNENKVCKQFYYFSPISEGNTFNRKTNYIRKGGEASKVQDYSTLAREIIRDDDKLPIKHLERLCP